MDLKESIQQLASTLRSSSLSAKSVLGESIENLKSSLPASASNFGAKNLLQNANLGSTKIDVTAAKKVAEENYKKLAAGLSGTTKPGAIQPPTSFVTSGSLQMVESVNLETVTSSFDISSLTGSEMTKLQNFLGVNSLSTDSVTLDALKGKLSTIQNEASSKSSSMLGSMKSSDKGILSGFTTSIQNATGFDISNFQSTVNSYLPVDLQRAVGSIAGRTTSQLTGKLSTINNAISSIQNLGSHAAAIFGLGGDYSEVTDRNGNPISGLAGADMDYNQINSLYKDARNICNNVDLLDLMEYSNMKDVYDILVNAALNGGLANLVRQLMNCGVFADQRTRYVMQSNVYNVASRGDIYTLNAIQEYVGPSGINSPKMTARTVATNMKYDTSSSAELDQFLSSHGLTRRDLVSDDDAPDGTISSQYVGFLSSKSTDLVDNIIGNDLKNTALQFLTTFG